VPAGGTGAWWATHRPVQADPDTHRVCSCLRSRPRSVFNTSSRLSAGRRADDVVPWGRYAVVRNPVLSLQALDRRRLASTGARAGRTGALSRRDTRARPRRARLSGCALVGRPIGDPHVRRARMVHIGGVAQGRRRLCRSRYLGDASGGGIRMSDGRHLWSDQPAPDRSLAGRRPAEPGHPAGTIRHRGNVWVVRILPCLPCELGCEGPSRNSRCPTNLRAHGLERGRPSAGTPDYVTASRPRLLRGGREIVKGV
jgi:hypothetical protein